MTKLDWLMGNKADIDRVAWNDLVDDSVRVLRDAFQDLAPSEALLRALVSERTGERDRGHFWASVYLRLIERT